MTLKVLQVVGAAAVVLLVLFLIPVLLKLRRTLDEVGRIVGDARPQTLSLLRKAQSTLDGVNKELEDIGEVTEDTQVLLDRVAGASDAVERAIKSPMSKAGFVAIGAATTGLAVKRRLSRRAKG